MMKGLRVLDAVRKANDVLVEQVNSAYYVFLARRELCPLDEFYC